MKITRPTQVYQMRTRDPEFDQTGYPDGTREAKLAILEEMAERIEASSRSVLAYKEGDSSGKGFIWHTIIHIASQFTEAFPKDGDWEAYWVPYCDAIDDIWEDETKMEEGLRRFKEAVRKNYPDFMAGQ
ncbi:hypothetical protein ABW19_dt0204479 [Dactylella cylindrospora]|nr:hypothetical protein ABW19_dt0204479 [Dactylella cylindrospora]